MTELEKPYRTTPRTKAPGTRTDGSGREVAPQVMQTGDAVPYDVSKLHIDTDPKTAPPKK